MNAELRIRPAPSSVRSPPQRNKAPQEARQEFQSEPEKAPVNRCAEVPRTKMRFVPTVCQATQVHRLLSTLEQGLLAGTVEYAEMRGWELPCFYLGETGCHSPPATEAQVSLILWHGGIYRFRPSQNSPVQIP